MEVGAGPGDLQALAEEFLAALVDSLETIPTFPDTATLLGAPVRLFTSPGTPIADCCEQIGVYVQTVLNRFQGDKGPAPRVPAPLLVGVVTRCVPQGTSKTVGKRLVYTPPTLAELNAASAQINADGWAITSHIYNLIAAEQFLTRCTGFTLEGITSITPSGGCAGWQVNVRVNLGAYAEELGLVSVGEIRQDAGSAVYVEIRMADCAQDFTAAALDLLVAVEDSDAVLVTDDALEKAHALRQIVETGALVTEVVFNERVLADILASPTGPVARDLARRATNVQSQAKLNASGRPGPNVQTGRLRSSITYEVVTDGGLVARIGSNVEYAAFVELGTDRAPPYPYLRPALPAAAL